MTREILFWIRITAKKRTLNRARRSKTMFSLSMFRDLFYIGCHLRAKIQNRETNSQRTFTGGLGLRNHHILSNEGRIVRADLAHLTRGRYELFSSSRNSFHEHFFCSTCTQLHCLFSFTYLFREERNVIEAAAKGASTAISLVANVTAMLITFFAFIAFFNAVLSYLGRMVGYPELSFQAS